MLKKYLATALIGSALLAPVAFAETPAATTDSGTTAQLSATTVRGEWRASKVVGLNVYNANNEKVGAIDDLLTDRNGTIKAVVIGVGGFLGMGEHLVALPFDKIKFVDEPVTSASNTTTTNRPASTTTTGSSTTTTTTTSATTPKADWYPDHAVFNATKDELKAMPEFKYSS